MKLKNLTLSIALMTSLNSVAAVGTSPADGDFVVYDDTKFGVYVNTGTIDGLQPLIAQTAWYSDAFFATQILGAYIEKYYPGQTPLPSPDLYAWAGGNLYAYAVLDTDPFGDTQNSVGFINDISDTFGQSTFNATWLLYYLYIDGPSAADTLASMQPNASAMKNAFNSQYAALAYGLNHDCTMFDTNGVCVSVFGRNTSLNDSSFDNNAAGLVLGYKPHAQFRIGTYIDQSLNNNTTGGVKVENSHPDIGVFGAWNMNSDGSGLELRAAANYGKRDINVARSVVGTSEAGSGSSDLNAYGALLEASFSHALNDSWMAKPYAGVRYLSIKRDGYTETTNADVQNPLSYSGLEQETTSAVVGVRLNGRLAPKLVASLNAGFEHDLHHSIDDYRATGVDDLGSIDMNSQKDRTRPTAGLGIAYDIADKQRLSANVQYRKEIFMSESSTTGQVTYTIGF